MMARYLSSFLASQSPRVYAIRVHTRESNRKQGAGGERRTCSSNGENGLGSVSFAYCIVLFYRNVRSGRAFRPILGPTTPRFDPRCPPRHFRRDCRKVWDKVISYFRFSLRPGNTRTFGNWRTVENVSATYSFAKLLGVYVIARYGLNEDRQWKYSPLDVLARMDVIWLGEPCLFKPMIAASVLLSLRWREFVRDTSKFHFICFEKRQNKSEEISQERLYKMIITSLW